MQIYFLYPVKLIVSILSILVFQSYCQVLDNTRGEAFTDKPFFNQQFIKENKLKQITGTYVYKKKNDQMRETEFHYTYNFDRDGRLVSTYETRTDDGTKDTTWNLYTYDQNNNLSSYSRTDQEGLNIINYQYDSIGRVTEKEYLREYEESDSLSTARSLMFNHERFSYVDYDRQTKCTHYNSYDLPYMDEYFNYNDLGYLVERIERIKMTSTIYTYTYEYNELGQLGAIRKHSNLQEEALEEFEFEYDELGNLSEKRINRNGVFVTEIQVIYNSKSKLLATTITRQVSTGFLMILRFRDYMFYD